MSLRVSGKLLLLGLFLTMASAFVGPSRSTVASQAQPGIIGLGAVDGSSVAVWLAGNEFTVRLWGVRVADPLDGLEGARIALLDGFARGRPLQLLVCGGGHDTRRVTLVDGDSRLGAAEALLRAGLAYADDGALLSEGCAPEALFAAQETARADGVGLWAASRDLPLASISLPAVPRSHDWRVPGYVGTVGGRIYDPSCHRMHSAGSNVPNLLYRAEWAETLAWMSAHQQRWLRLFVTGHGQGAQVAAASGAEAGARLQQFLRQVEAFNAARPAAQSIYVLVVLTDYYQPGVPGDRYAYDNPYWGEQPVLPAFWYRSGVRAFAFDQEHGRPPLLGMPNYEVNYKPWVRAVVAAGATSPAVYGWQIGNELKARESVRNGVDAAVAYEWYLQFTRDIVDTIREVDQNHLVFQGAQYMAEATDWGYRLATGPDSALVAHYRSLVERMLGACGRYCWNVWSLTGYDYSPWFLDDAAEFARRGVAAVITEYGFTRGTEAEMTARYGGDRPSAIRSGLDRSWIDLGGAVQSRYWGAAELVARGPVAGIAPWASPAPGPGSGLDADVVRGITSAPDEGPLWAAWREVGQRLELRNAQASVSAPCLLLDSRAPTSSTAP